MNLTVCGICFVLFGPARVEWSLTSIVDDSEVISFNSRINGQG